MCTSHLKTLCDMDSLYKDHDFGYLPWGYTMSIVIHIFGSEWNEWGLSTQHWGIFNVQ